MSGALTPVTPRLAKLLPLLSSDKDGEVLATVGAIRRTLESAGCDFHGLVASLAIKTLEAPKADFRSVADLLRDLLACQHLSAWERRFCNDLARRVWDGRSASPAQISKLGQIYEQRIGGAA